MIGVIKMSEITIGSTDIQHLKIIRENVASFMKYVSNTYAKADGRLLDIAPQDHEGAKSYFSNGIIIETFDLNPSSGCTFIGDICEVNEFIADESYEYIVCTEVLEHVLQPFSAVNEMHRILKPGGFLFLSTPFNFRIHGPLPDCWRFTEHGLRALLRNFSILELNQVDTLDRPLMPIHYTLCAQKA
jgi:SAM-dependent methyltransferase